MCVCYCATATSKISVKYTNIFHFTTCNLKLLEMRLCDIILLVTSYKTNIITNKMIVQRGPGLFPVIVASLHILLRFQ
jgi:hypothetical protein